MDHKEAADLPEPLQHKLLKIKKVTVDNIVRAIPFGRFQILMILIFHLIYSAPSIVVYNYAFFLLYPSYLCKDGINWVSCSREEMCR